MTTAQTSRLNDQLIEDIADRIGKGKQVRRTLPPGGRIHIDRQLPFLFVYRPPGADIDSVIAGLVNGEASYLIAPARSRAQKWTGRLVERIANVLTETFGGFLIIEIWPGTDANGAPEPRSAEFRVFVDKNWADSATIERLTAALGDVRVMKRTSKVSLQTSGRLTPPSVPPLLAPHRASSDPHHRTSHS